MNPLRSLVSLAAAAALVVAAAGCSTGPTDARDSSGTTAASAEPGAYPVSIRHAFGSTRITSEPKRVVTVGWSDQDTALALGVVPVGSVKVTWGGNADGSTPWFDAALQKVGGKQPVRYDDADGIPFDDIARLSPDLVLATNSGLTRADYTRLSKIAPVVAYPKVAWGTSWQDSTEMVGEALGRPDRADRLVDRTEGDLDSFTEQHPALEDKTFVFATFDAKDTSQVGFYTPLDNRPQMLEELGMDSAPVVEKLSRGSNEFWKTVSAERANTLRSDVLVTYGESAGDEAKVVGNPLFGQIPAIRSGASAFLVVKTDSLTMSSPTVLGMPWFLDKVAPSIAKAAQRADQKS